MSESDQVLAKFKKDFGEGAGGKGTDAKELDRIPTGIFQFDLASGGGFPCGRISIVVGTESSTKTSLALLAAKATQKKGLKAVVIALEPWDGAWAKKLGVDVDELIVLFPDTAEQAVDMAQAILYADDVGILIIDSLGQMTTENEINSGAEKMIVAGSSLVCGRLVRKIGVALSVERKRNHFPAVVLINQIRYKVGVMFGDPETMPGGMIVRFASAMTVRLSGRIGEIAKGEPLPKVRKVSGTFKKGKLPVVSQTFEYEFTLIAHDGIGIGETKSWNTVQHYLKAHGVLKKKGIVWDLLGAEFKTLGEIEAKYMAEPEIRLALQGEVLKRAFTDLPKEEE